MKITLTEAIAHAEIAAVFVRRLIADGIDPAMAVNLTGTYLLGLASRPDSPEPPREPWEGA